MFVSGFVPVLRFIVVALIALLVTLSSSLLLLFRNILSFFIRSLLFLFSLGRLLQYVFGLFSLLLRPAYTTSRVVINSFVFGLIYIRISDTISIHSVFVMQVLGVLQVTGIADQVSFVFFFTLIRRIFLKEKRAFVVIGYIVVVIVILSLIVFVTEIGI